MAVQPAARAARLKMDPLRGVRVSDRPGPLFSSGCAAMITAGGTALLVLGA